jgi:hypothetical protein
MGYSLSVPCKSGKARDRLYGFLSRALRPFTDDIRAKFNDGLDDSRRAIPLPSAAADHAYDPTRYVHVGNGLAYGSGPSKVGFNFSTQGQFSTYMHAVCAWAALRVGRTRGLNALAVVGQAHQRVPYYTYDNEPIPALLPSHMLDWPDNAREHGRTHWEVTHLGLRVADEVARTHAVMPEEWAKTPEEKAWLTRLAARDEAIRTIVEREMRRLDVLWDEFVDREER